MSWWRKRGPDPADEALAETREALEAARARGERLRSIAAHLREIRTVNHLAQNVRDALGDSQ
jgi:hypothetical protein